MSVIFLSVREFARSIELNDAFQLSFPFFKGQFVEDVV